MTRPTLTPDKLPGLDQRTATAIGAEVELALAEIVRDYMRTDPDADVAALVADAAGRYCASVHGTMTRPMTRPALDMRDEPYCGKCGRVWADHTHSTIDGYLCLPLQVSLGSLVPDPTWEDTRPAEQPQPACVCCGAGGGPSFVVVDGVHHWRLCDACMASGCSNNHGRWHRGAGCPTLGAEPPPLCKSTNGDQRCVLNAEHDNVHRGANAGNWWVDGDDPGRGRRFRELTRATEEAGGYDAEFAAEDTNPDALKGG